MLKNYREITNVNVFDSEYLEVIKMLERKAMIKEVIKEAIITMVIIIGLFVGGLTVMSHADTVDTFVVNAPYAYGEYVKFCEDYISEHCCENNYKLVILDSINNNNNYWKMNRAGRYELVEHCEVEIAGYTTDGRAYGYDTDTGEYIISNFTNKTIEVGAVIDSYFVYDDSNTVDGITTHMDFVQSYL